MNKFKIIKNPKKYINQLIDLYSECFEMPISYARFDLVQNINMKESVAMLCDDKIVSFVGVSVKHVIHNNKNKTIALLGSIMTKKEYRGLKLSYSLINSIIDNLLVKYSSVIIQTHHWEIYKGLDIEELVIKKNINVDLNNLDFDFKNLIFKPNVKSIKLIEKSKNENYSSMIRTNKQIKETINLCLESNLKFIANKNAYIWYSENKIDSIFYNNLMSLFELLKYINIGNNVIVFDNNELEKMSQIVRKQEKIVVTKVFKKSYEKIKNLNIIDFEL